MKIKTIEMADKILYRISEIDRDLTVAQNRTDGIIADAKNAYAEYSQSLETEKTAMIEALHEFTDNKREEILRGNQSASLVNGIIGYRKGRATVECSADTADKLIAAGLGAFVKIEKKPAAAALINLQLKKNILNS